jgi:hypothetical protein
MQHGDMNVKKSWELRVTASAVKTASSVTQKKTFIAKAGF